MSVQSGWGRFTWGQAYWNRDALLATGWGAKAWNDGEWGNLADETASLTGVSITSNIGAVGILANALVEPYHWEGYQILIGRPQLLQPCHLPLLQILYKHYHGSN